MKGLPETLLQTAAPDVFATAILDVEEMRACERVTLKLAEIAQSTSANKGGLLEKVETHLEDIMNLSPHQAGEKEHFSAEDEETIHDLWSEYGRDVEALRGRASPPKASPAARAEAVKR
ncbi:unnamed protein product, partial [Amoebophrya sp. A25]|eukprot:GSA25T00016965001.1